MSIESIVWALNDAPIPRDRRDASSLTVVLLGLANHADPFGRNAFPALSTLVRYTRLSERSVRYAIRSLEELELIRPSDPDIVAAYIKRSDRRPNGYDLAVERVEVVDNSVTGGQTLPPGDQRGGQAAQVRGASSDTTGGKHCPRNVLNRPENRPSPECGQCDARPSDPVSARLVWLDEARALSAPCPNCSPTHARTEAQR